jgi:hypothetical protein
VPCVRAGAALSRRRAAAGAAPGPLRRRQADLAVWMAALLLLAGQVLPVVSQSELEGLVWGLGVHSAEHIQHVSPTAQRRPVGQ